MFYKTWHSIIFVSRRFLNYRRDFSLINVGNRANYKCVSCTEAVNKYCSPTEQLTTIISSKFLSLPTQALSVV